FFFSSRRRHTRFSRDWSSDVCSSDLPRRYRRRSAAAVRGTAGRTKTPSLRTTGRRRSRRRARTWRKERGHANGSASPATYRDPAATRSPGGPVYSAFVVTGGTLVTHRIQD